jgi:putative cell wall-binding protein
MRIKHQLVENIFFGVIVLAALIVGVAVYRSQPAKVPAQLTLPGPQTFIESFDSTTYRDINYSTALWDTTTGTLSVPSNRTTAVGISLNIDHVSDSIEAATLAFTANNQGTVAFFLSNDAGATFEPITPGEEHIFTSSGSKLKWKAELTKDVLGLSPILDQVDIEYTISEPDHLLQIRAADPIHLAIETSKQLFDDGTAEAIVLSRADDVIDSFVATPLAIQRKAPILFTNSDHLDPQTATEMSRVMGRNVKPVILLGGETALGSQIIQDLAARGFRQVQRFGGATRYETAQQIAETLIQKDPAAAELMYVTEARFLADGFSASAAAGATNNGTVHPIVLLERGASAPHSATKSVVAESSPQTLVVVGGAASISDAEINGLVSGQNITVDRQAGPDRFATNAIIVQEHFASPESVVVAEGQPKNDTMLSSYERLLAGFVAARHNAPLILVPSSGITQPMVDYLYAKAGTIVTGIVIGSIQNEDISTQLYNLISHG